MSTCADKICLGELFNVVLDFMLLDFSARPGKLTSETSATILTPLGVRKVDVTFAQRAKVGDFVFVREKKNW